MPRNAILGNFAATLAATAPVLAMVAGLAAAHVIASAAGITTQTSAMGDHPRRAARTAALVAHDHGQATSFGTADRRTARADTPAGGDLLAAAARRDGAGGDSSRARIISRQ
ncbi:hypothetical protein ACVDG3_10380 [Meridianimarinicoccus sp. RP-17]|uniref:hypothetical protein n=1 Tax=Meridianimarinicoccus zhengii TaxID=2056810 RepID=UPI000DAEB359|nr:hypothetical protein [Phycocomes zhengii]